MKVLHISSGNLYGGVEVLLSTLSRERFSCPEMEPSFAICFPGRLSRELEETGVAVTILGPLHTRYPWQVHAARQRLARLLAQDPVDLVICHMPWTHAIFGPVVREAGIGLVFWMHDLALGKHWVERWASNCPPDFSIVNSQFTARSLPKLFRNRSSHAVLHGVVSRPSIEVTNLERERLRQEFETAPDSCVIIQVGRMEPYKGGLLHLEALSRLRDLPGWTCWIVGGAQRKHEMDHMNHLTRFARETGISERVRFLGERADVRRLLGAADVFCQPNISPEPLGLVFIEALYAGLPVVSTAGGGVVEIIRESNGRLVPFGKPQALADALSELVLNPVLRRELGASGPQRAAELCGAPESVTKLYNICTQARDAVLVRGEGRFRGEVMETSGASPKGQSRTVPLRVLHITSGNLYGGVEVFTKTISRDRNCCPDMKPSFALGFEGRLSEELTSLGTPAAILGPVRTRYPWQVWTARQRLAKLLRENTFDVVICRMAWSLAIFGPVVKRARVPLVFWLHDVAQGKHWVERWASRCKPDLAICNSRFTARSLNTLFPSGVPFEVIHSSVPPPPSCLSESEQIALRAKYDTPRDACVIIQVGRMEPYKGASLHIDALGHLADVPGWVCWIVGGVQRPHEAEYLEDLKKRARLAGIADRVRFVGEQKNVSMFLQASDIFCQPNLRPEPFGIVFIEALYAGLPVVSTAIGGVLEIVDEKTGRLVQPESAQDLAAVLKSLIANEQLRTDLGRSGPLRAASLSSPEVVLNNLAKTLRSLISPTSNVAIAAGHSSKATASVVQ